MPDPDPNYVDPILLSEIGHRVGAGTSLGNVRLFLENWASPRSSTGTLVKIL